MSRLKVLCAVSVLLLTSPVLGLAASDGVYTGTTSQGRAISFTVSGGVIDEYSISYSCGFSATNVHYLDCAIAGDGSFTCGSAYCSSAPFAANIEVSGTFSGTSVSGSFDVVTFPCQFACSCCYLSDATFTASLPSTDPQISIGDVVVTEGDTGTTLAQFDVTLSFGVNEVVTVGWVTADGTADTTDFASASGTVTFGAQQTAKTVDVVVYGDTDEETDEVFYVNLSNPTNGEIDDEQGQCTITDDDGPVVETLYDQTDNQSNWGYAAQDFESIYDDYDCEMADDFTVPAGGWTINRVELSGFYSDGGGPLEGVNLWFHRDQAGWPGSGPVCSYSGVVPTSNGAGSLSAGVIAVDLPTGCALAPGTYWLVAQIGMDFATGDRIYLTRRSMQSGYEAVWRQPGDGWETGATSWTRMTEIDPDDESTDPDMIFLLAGDGAPPLFTDGFESGDTSAWSNAAP
jgi:hypothetical protein